LTKVNGNALITLNMYQVTVTSQGQVTLPVDMRRRMGIKAKDRINIIPESADWKKMSITKSTGWEELRGILKPYAVGKPRLTKSRLEKLREEFYTERYRRYLKQNE